MVLTSGGIVLSWCLYAAGSFGRRRPVQGSAQLREITCAAFVTAALGGVAAAELRGAATPEALWAEVALTASALTIFLLDAWLAFRTARFAVSFLLNFLGCVGATAGLVAALMGLAVRLYPRAPFGALVVGVLSFFLPVNALAEVFHAGAAARRDVAETGREPKGR